MLSRRQPVQSSCGRFECLRTFDTPTGRRVARYLPGGAGNAVIPRRNYGVTPPRPSRPVVGVHGSTAWIYIRERVLGVIGDRRRRRGRKRAFAAVLRRSPFKGAFDGRSWWRRDHRVVPASPVGPVAWSRAPIDDAPSRCVHCGRRRPLPASNDLLDWLADRLVSPARLFAHPPLDPWSAGERAKDEEGLLQG